MSEAPALEHLSSGKVRDIYAVGEDRLLLVASDRISTYDVVHPTPIPDKGKVLTGLTAFWLERTGAICPNHLISYSDVPEEFRGRAMLTRPVEGLTHVANMPVRGKQAEVSVWSVEA